MKRTLGPFWLDPRDPAQAFPETRFALHDPNGLLAVGGDLSSERLLAAYRRGIFPWYSEEQPILWWTPNPRAVLYADELKISRSLRKTLRQRRFDIRLDTAFEAVLQACSEPRKGQPETWLSPEMKRAYLRLYQLGHAHSAESWLGDRLVGGLYGVSVGRMFFGESMFAHVTDASKVVFVHLVQQLRNWGFGPVDCQIGSSHLASLGAREVPRTEFIALLDHYCEEPPPPYPWTLSPEVAENC